MRSPSRLVFAIAFVLAIAIGTIANSSIWTHDPFVNLRVSPVPYQQSNPRLVADGAGGAILVWEHETLAPLELVAIDMVNSVTGFALGTNGEVARTDDAWMTAESLTLPSTGWLNDLQFMSVDTGVLVGANGLILRTTDGGISWSVQTSGTVSALNGLCFLDSNTGWVVGDNGEILHTTDGGMNWSAQTSGTSADLYAVDFPTASIGFVVGGPIAGPTIRRTLNAGADWLAAPSSGIPSEDLFGVAFWDVSHAVVVGGNGTIAHLGSGPDWDDRSGFTMGEELLDVEFAPDSVTVFAVGRNTGVYRSTDAGYTWTLQATEELSVWGGDVYGVSVVDASTLAIAIENGPPGVYWSVDQGASWDARGPGPDIYAQRLAADGSAVWTMNGEALSTVPLAQVKPQLAADGDHGAIVVWEDSRDVYPDIYAQHVDQNGNALWQTDGAPVCTLSSYQQLPQVVADQAGGAFIAWKDGRLGINIYAQRINGLGTAQWVANGIPLTTAGGGEPRLAADGFGSAIAAWYNGDVYAQKVDEDGNVLWGTDGVQVSIAGAQSLPAVVADGFGGAVIAWLADSGGDQIVAQRVLAVDGQKLWGPGVVVADTANINMFSAVSDDNGGLVVVWSDDRNGTDDIYIQRVSAAGTMEWMPNGVFLGDAGTSQFDLSAIADGTGGAIVTWTDMRNGTRDVYGQRVAGDGSILWDSDALLISGALNNQVQARTVADGLDGAITAWSDTRSGAPATIYAQRFDRHGYLGRPAPRITSIVDAPGDQGGWVIVSWEASYLDAHPAQTIVEYSVWRRNQGSPGTSVVERASSDVGSSYARAREGGIDGALAFSLSQSGWVYLDKVPAYYLQEYGFDAPTYGDSTDAGSSYTGFMVIGHTADQFVFWTSEADSGYSVDNLAPGAPGALTGEGIGGDAGLTWRPSTAHAEDLSHYAVYRNGTSGFTPGPGTFLDSAFDTTYVDSTTGGQSFYYIVTAVDIHNNEGQPSNEAYVQITTGVGDPTQPAPQRLMLMPNAPNPFKTATTIGYGIPEASNVEIEVYDIVGRRVFTETLPAIPAGWHSYVFRGEDSWGRSLSSGTYFYRLSAAGKTMTGKMVITK